MIFNIGISTCPNDTYIFGAILEGFVKTPHTFFKFMDDIEVLNNKALCGDLDIVKVSYGLVPSVTDKYSVLTAGGALGFGCGPLIVALEKFELEQNKGARIAIPGKHTSAFRFFRHFFGSDFEFVEMRFDAIMPAVKEGKVKAGLVIHEGRFIYEQEGLTKLYDLGELWEAKYNSPIPLGAILIRNELKEYAEQINSLIRESIQFADTRYSELEYYVKKYAQELDDKVISEHIKLYVNDYSKDMSPAIDGICSFLEVDKRIFV
jgi:1,4-dihydroxy-6-naphthoate synthase